MIYNITASRKLLAALRDVFADQRFDEYAILARADRLPLDFLDSRKTRQRVMIAHWLRWAAEQGIGLERDADNPTWFRVCHGARVTGPPTPGAVGGESQSTIHR
jgi:hypothetical protein